VRGYESDRSCDPGELRRLNQFLKTNLPEKIRQDIHFDLDVLPESLQQSILGRLDTVVQLATDRLFVEFSEHGKTIAQSAEDVTIGIDESFPTTSSQYLFQAHNDFPELDAEKKTGGNKAEEPLESNQYFGHNNEGFNFDEYQTSFVFEHCTDGQDPFPQLLSSMGPLGFGSAGTEAIGFSC
jgi:hypothetical protein